MRDRGLRGDDDTGSGDNFESTIDRLPASALEGVGDSSPELYYSDMANRWDELELADATPEERSRQPFDRQRIDRFPLVPLMIEPELQSQLDESRTEVGFTAFDIEREATVVQLPRSLSVAEVRVDAETIDDAVRSDPAWSDDLEEIDFEDGSYYSWGEDGARMDPGRRGPFHGMLGRGGQLAVASEGDDEAVTTVRALSTEEIEAALDTEAG